MQSSVLSRAFGSRSIQTLERWRACPNSYVSQETLSTQRQRCYANVTAMDKKTEARVALSWTAIKAAVLENTVESLATLRRREEDIMTSRRFRAEVRNVLALIIFWST